MLAPYGPATPTRPIDLVEAASEARRRVVARGTTRSKSARRPLRWRIHDWPLPLWMMQPGLVSRLDERSRGAIDVFSHHGRRSGWERWRPSGRQWRRSANPEPEHGHGRLVRGLTSFSFCARSGQAVQALRCVSPCRRSLFAARSPWRAAGWMTMRWIVLLRWPWFRLARQRPARPWAPRSLGERSSMRSPARWWAFVCRANELAQAQFQPDGTAVYSGGRWTGWAWRPWNKGYCAYYPWVGGGPGCGRRSAARSRRRLPLLRRPRWERLFRPVPARRHVRRHPRARARVGRRAPGPRNLPILAPPSIGEAAGRRGRGRPLPSDDRAERAGRTKVLHDRRMSGATTPTGRRLSPIGRMQLSSTRKLRVSLVSHRQSAGDDPAKWGLNLSSNLVRARALAQQTAARKWARATGFGQDRRHGLRGAAAAREMVGFIWAIARQVQLQPMAWSGGNAMSRVGDRVRLGNPRARVEPAQAEASP